MWKTWLQRRALAKQIFRCEWWIYSQQPKLPDGTAIMDRMIAGNPHNRRGFAPIGAREGLIFSDVRLHVRLALRAKNPHLFRPDLLADHPAGVTRESLKHLSEQTSAVIVRYVGKGALTDHRHIPFMAHLADAYASLMESPVIFDVVTECMSTQAEFFAALDARPQVDQPEQLVRVGFFPETAGGRVRTFGLVKLGLPEWETAALPLDQEVIATAAVEAAMEQVVREQLRAVAPNPEQLEVEVHGVRVQLQWERTRSERLQVRIFQISG
ncbi:MAG: hypothetical protein JNJ45_12940 [Chthonomonas sp.]|nr:hypothetical protein [Chthonomonas sp.]